MHLHRYNNYNPTTRQESIILGEKYRISILTDKLIRLEYSERGMFEDGQSLTVLNRDFKTPNFDIFDSEYNIKIVTSDLIVTYDKMKFSPYGLSVELRGKVSDPYRSIWHFGDKPMDLGGTARTLDQVDGEVDLEPGILSQYGITALDDSNSPIFTEDGWFRKRDSNDIDLYIFGFKRDYLEALDCFYQLTGKQPKLPRYVFGNWWSRYFEYSNEDYKNLVKKFDEYKIPFSVMVMDMDWHKTGIDSKYGTDWTGYSWDRELMGEPTELLSHIKDHNYHTTLNIHPASGIRPHEDIYEAMAAELSIDTSKEESIDFRPYSKEFFDSLFKNFFHPNENIGVDFWWIDWQQSPHSHNKNDDPMWILNHYHYLDNIKDDKLGLTFSRYFGVGSHRYPIGFSGDSVISWESLNFQPYFTSTASNIGYGWWSHDIGGHMWGVPTNELILRWIEYGVFSPINRLHSSKTLFLEKEPWTFDQPYRDHIIAYLRLRHKLIPYIYTMNIKAYEENVPFIRPLYYYHPYEPNAYDIKNEYYFGDDLLICPMTSPLAEASQMSKFTAYLPQGSWYDLQTGLSYEGNRRLNIYRKLDKIGIFAKAGTIIVLDDIDKAYSNLTHNPKKLHILLTAGADASFTLREDNNEYKANVEGASTNFSYDDKAKILCISKAMGNTEVIPEHRSYRLSVYGLKVNKARVNDRQLNISYDQERNITTIELGEYAVDKDVVIYLDEIEYVSQIKNKQRMIVDIIKHAHIELREKDGLYETCMAAKDERELLSNLLSSEVDEDVIEAIIEIITASRYYE